MALKETAAMQAELLQEPADGKGGDGVGVWVVIGGELVVVGLSEQDQNGQRTSW